jgi:DNA-binding XRE family transcriptional regulator
MRTGLWFALSTVGSTITSLINQWPKAPVSQAGFGGLDCAQVGRAIEQLRTERSLTIEQVATKTDLSAEQLARIEDRERDPTWTAFYRIAVALDTTATLLSYAIEVEPPSRAEPSD